jgi:hypothetical protein
MTLVSRQIVIPLVRGLNFEIVSPSGSNMTDGAGKINRWSLNQLRHRLRWEETPTAIQMRVFGTKVCCSISFIDAQHLELKIPGSSR